MVRHFPLFTLLLAGSLLVAEETKFEKWSNWTKDTVKQITQTTLDYGKKGLEPLKTVALYWAVLQVCGIGASHLCNLLGKISPVACAQPCIDAVNPAVSKNMLTRYGKMIPWVIACSCLLGYTSEVLKKKINKKEKEIIND